MLHWQTSVSLPTAPTQITHRDGMVFVGSCFAKNIAQRAQYYGFRCQPPLGAQYNPITMGRVLERMEKLWLVRQEELIYDRERVACHDFHSDFNQPDAPTYLHGVNTALKQAHQALADSRFWIITLGTSYVYRQKQTGYILANCHHADPASYTREVATEEAMWQSLFPLCQRHTDKHIILTVSPVRYLQHGAHDNQLSKARLLLLCERLCRALPHCSYFPAYEIVMDELRDYRYYEDDLIHPSSKTVDYLWQRFSENWFSAETQQLCQQVEALRKQAEHRPFDPESALTRQAAELLAQKKEALQHLHPELVL